MTLLFPLGLPLVAWLHLAPPESAPAEDAGLYDPQGLSLPAPVLFTKGVSATLARRQVGLGIFETPSQSPGQLPRMGIAPVIPSTLGEGQWEVSWRETLTNIWAQEFKTPKFRFDYGQLYSAARLSYGLTDRVVVSIDYHNQSRFDSVLDPITNGFHDLFGLHDGGRDDFPDNDNALEYPDLGVDVSESGSIRDNVAVSFEHTFYDGDETWPTLSWSASWRENLYTDTDAGGDGDGALGVSLSLAKRFTEKDHVYLVLGLVRHEHEEFDLGSGAEVEFEKQQPSVLLAYERRYTPKCSLVAQYLYTGKSSDDLDPFNEGSHEIVFGWKGRVGPATLLELGLIENTIVADNSPDFGVHFGLTHRF